MYMHVNTNSYSTCILQSFNLRTSTLNYNIAIHLSHIKFHRTRMRSNMACTTCRNSIYPGLHTRTTFSGEARTNRGGVASSGRTTFSSLLCRVCRPDRRLLVHFCCGHSAQWKLTMQLHVRYRYMCTLIQIFTFVTSSELV